jgi:hypothetical protein
VFICGSAYALQGSAAGNGSNAKAVHDLGITGQGVKVGLITARNVFSIHLAFLDSNGVSGVFNHDYTGKGIAYYNHDTIFAGIIKSRGSYDHLDYIGVAPDAEIHCSRVVDNNDNISLTWLKNALDGLIVTYGCKVIVTGIQLPPNFDQNWSHMYDYYAEQYDVVFANAAGNDYANVSIFGDGYNGITTGGLEDTFPSVPDDYDRDANVTCPGPTLDGRRKPDVMAPSTNQVTPGYSGGWNNYWNTTSTSGATSWAVPHTAGVAALLLEYANGTSESSDGHSEVIKAVIVNSTFPNINAENGNPTNPADPNNTWNRERGYGRIDALRAVDTLDANKISKGTTVITSTAGWAYDTMSSSSTHTYLIAGKKNERLILTVDWNRLMTKSGSEYLDETSPFNIDVTVKNPASEVIFDENDILNNLIKVDLLLPADGNYTISLYNTTSKSRSYGLAFEILPPLTGDFYVDYIVDVKDLNRMALEWLTAGPDTDIVHDDNQIVNWRDFAAFADNWLKIDNRYFTP